MAAINRSLKATMTEMFLFKVTSEADNQSNFSRVHHYIKFFGSYFGEPPILADPRRLKVVNEIFFGGENVSIERSASRGIRYYILKTDPVGQVIYLIIKDIFHGRTEIMIPKDFKIEKKFVDWYGIEKKRKTKLGKPKKYFSLTKKAIQDIMEINENE